MRFSFYASPVYSDLEGEAPTGWPVAPKYYKPEIGQRSVDIALRQAVLAEKLGFDMVSVSEHHYWPYSPCPNSAVLAGALTQVTSRVRIGLMGPLVSISNPVRIAEEIAMIDQLSHGRVEAMLLRGTPNEFVAYNVTPGDTRERTQEAIELIIKALTEAEPFEWKRKFYDFPVVSVWPGVSQRPHPPIYASGNSPESVRWAADHGCKLALSFYSAPQVAQLVQQYRDACVELRKPILPDIMYRSHIVVGETDEEAAALVEKYYGEGGLGPAAIATTVSMFNPGLPTELGTDADGKNTGADAKGSARGFALGMIQFSGSPDTVRRQISQFCEKTGVDTLDLGFTGGGLTEAERTRSLTLFGQEVLPKLSNALAMAET